MCIFSLCTSFSFDSWNPPNSSPPLERKLLTKSLSCNFQSFLIQKILGKFPFFHACGSTVKYSASVWSFIHSQNRITKMVKKVITVILVKEGVNKYLAHCTNRTSRQVMFNKESFVCNSWNFQTLGPTEKVYFTYSFVFI